MKVNFDKSDRLIELLEDSFGALSGGYYWGAYKLAHSGNPVIRNLYSELVDITHCDISEEEKNLQRIKSFAKAYGHENDLEFGERRLKHTFDENRILDYLTRVYWQIQPFVKFADETVNNFSDIDKFRQFIEKWYPDEPCKDVMIDVIRKQEPDVKSIEAEFWVNCTEADQINNWCNIYRERFNNHIKEVDEKFYEDIFCGFDGINIYYQYFKDLRLTGLLKQKEGDIEARLWHIAQSINIISNKIVELFKGLRSSAQNTLITNKSIPENKTQDQTQPIYPSTDEVKPDYSDLLNQLSNYVTEITPLEFTNIIENHSLTHPSAHRAKWKGQAVDAHRFATELKMKISKWNKCFEGVPDRNGNLRPLRHSDKDKITKDSPIADILKPYFSN